MFGIGDAVGKGVREGVRQGLENAVPSIVDTVIDALFSSKTYPFRMGMQYAFMSKGMEAKKAWDLAGSTISEYLKDEKIRFGDSRYSWTAADGHDVAYEYEIEHWEAA